MKKVKNKRDGDESVDYGKCRKRKRDEKKKKKEEEVVEGDDVYLEEREGEKKVTARGGE